MDPLLIQKEAEYVVEALNNAGALALNSSSEIHLIFSHFELEFLS